MELSQQVVSLNLAKRLKELNLPQESLFYWHKSTLTSDWYLTDFKSDRGISAFTSTEQGALLPHVIFDEKEKLRYVLKMTKSELMSGKIYYRIEYVNYGNALIGKLEEKEADVRAQMLIHLIENNLLKL